jgi:hypothetical protein
MRRVLFVTAAVVAAVIFFGLATLPPAPLAVDSAGIDPDLIRRTVRGAYHIHSTRSDGASDKAAIASAAARAGLKFIIVTDHGDGTTPPDPPAYLSGVLCIDGVEISTNGGHYVALGMPPSPYPLGGDPAAVVEDVARLGGFGIAAHPDSPKASLAWTDWEAPIDGIEWLNTDSEWRDESRTTLAHVFLHYLVRPGPALASMLDRPVTTLKRWDELTKRRPVVALAAHDAHGGIGRGLEESGARKRTLGTVPSYEASFRTFSDNVILDAPLSGDGAKDGRAVIDAIRHGRVFTVIDAIATPGLIDFRAWQGDIPKSSNMGVSWPTGPAAMSARIAMPAGAQVMLIDRGREYLGLRPPDYATGMDPGETIRIEVRLPGAPGSPPVPWLVSNPVYFLAPAPRSSAAASDELVPLPGDLGWHVEKDPDTNAADSRTTEKVSLQYTLAAGARRSQFAALAADLKGGLPGLRQLMFSGSSTGPSRVSVQLRYAQRGGERWGSSVYLDSNDREVSLPLDRMRPLDRQTGPAPDAATASSLLFVIDLTNAKPGDSNSFTISKVGFSR